MLYISDIYIKLHNKEKCRLEKNEKNILIQTIDEIYPEFKSSIYGLVPKLSTDELYMCYLIKTNLRPIDIAHQMCKERSSISMKQTRLSKKMFGENGTIKMLNEFIHNI